MSACTEDVVLTGEQLIQRHNALIAEIRAEQMRVSNDPKVNLAKNVAVIADLLKVMLLGAIIVTGYLAWRFVL
jgi:hypothetical protein